MVTQFNDTYRNKTVLVTGHTGFKGSWLSLWLSQLGARVVGYSKDIPTVPSHWEILKLPIISIEGDILNLDNLTSVIVEYKPDIIFHLAAQSLVRRSYTDPVGTYQANVMGSMHVFEAVRKTKVVQAIVNITTDKCYDNKEKLEAYVEDDPMGGYDPYSSSKGCAEILTSSFRHSFFSLETYGKNHNTLLASARSGNVIGGGDWAEDRLLPDLMRASNNHTKAKIRNPQAVRPWQHVLEPLSGYLQLGQHLLEKDTKCAEGWNFGPDESQQKTVAAVIDACQQVWSNVKTQIDKDDHPHEAGLLLLNSEKARTKLGWNNIWSYETAIQHTVEWYKQFYDSTTVISRQQLDCYIQSAQKQKAVWVQ